MADISRFSYGADTKHFPTAAYSPDECVKDTQAERICEDLSQKHDALTLSHVAHMLLKMTNRRL